MSGISAVSPPMRAHSAIRQPIAMPSTTARVVSRSSRPSDIHQSQCLRFHLISLSMRSLNILSGLTQYSHYLTQYSSHYSQSHSFSISLNTLTRSHSILSQYSQSHSMLSLGLTQYSHSVSLNTHSVFSISLNTHLISLNTLSLPVAT